MADVGKGLRLNAEAAQNAIMNSCIYKEVHPPTGVTHTTSAYLTREQSGSQIPDLVVAYGTRLEVYHIRVAADQAAGQQAVDRSSGCWQLERLASYPLFGVVESLTTLRSREPGVQRDSLLLTFRDAKVSVLEWDDAAWGLRTSSMHYFEGDAALREGHAVFPRAPHVVADHQGRCAAVIMFQHQLALLPAMEVDQFDFMSPAHDVQHGQLGSAAAVCNSYVLNLSRQGINIHEVRNAAFLHGYTEPVLLLLHEPDPTWVGRYRDRKDTCMLTAVSLNLRRKRHTVLWTASGLPSDSFRVVPVPERPAAIILSQNFIMYYSQGSHYAVATNSLAFPGELPPKLEFNLAVEPPHVTASKMAREYVRNVHPEVASAMSKVAVKVPELEVELDAARAEWLSPTCCLLCTKTGQQLALHVKFEGAADNRLQVVRLSGAPVASGLCHLGNSLLFLGSWTGDSLLIHYSLEAAGATGGKGGRAAKRRRLMASSSIKEEEEEEDDDEGPDMQQQLLQPDGPAKVVLRVVDSLPGLGPVRDLLHLDTTGTVGAAVDTMQRVCMGTLVFALRMIVSPMVPHRGGPTVYACVGHDKTGALAVLRQGLIPEMVTEVPLASVHGLWSIHYRREDGGMEADEKPVALDGAADGATADGSEAVGAAAPEDDGGTGGGADYHAYLLLSKEGRSTMVLETGEELQEVTDRSSYITDQPTLAAGNLFNNAGICQVCPTALRVYDGMTPIQELTIPELLLGSPAAGISVRSAQILDPYVLLHLSNGQAMLLEGDFDSMTLGLCGPAVNELYSRGAADPTDLVAAACLYRDECRWLERVIAGNGSSREHDGQASLAAAGLRDDQANGEVAVVAANGDGDVAMEEAPGQPRAAPAAVLPATEDGPADDACSSPPEASTSYQHYLAVARRSGGLEIFLLPELQLVFSCQGLSAGRRVLTHQPPAAPQQQQEQEGEEEQRRKQQQAAARAADPSQVVELRFESFRGSSTERASSAGSSGTGLPPCERPALLVLHSSGQLLAYQAFKGTSSTGRASVAFARLPLEWASHEAPAALPGVPASSRMTRFDGIAYSDPVTGAPGPSQSGVFVCGARPMWLVACRGTLLPHPMFVEGPITAMTPFHNVNCPFGFIVSATSGSIKVCQLPYRSRLDTHWVSHKLALRATPHKLAHYKEGNLLALLLSRPMPYRPRLPEEPGGDAHASAMYAAAEASAQALGREEGYEVRLLELPAVSQQAVSGKPILLQPGETANAIKVVYLKDTSSESVGPMLAIGTSFLLGEDYPCLGRVLLYKLERGSRDLGGGNIDLLWQAKQVYQRDLQGPVTSVQDFKGFLLASAGNKVEMYAWNDRSLVKRAFFDMPLLITSLNIVKDYILLGDVHKGVYFIRYVEASRVLEMLGKDFEQHDVNTTGIIINVTKLLFIFADAAGTLRQMEYKRNDPASWNGQRLLPRGQLHTGHIMTKFHSIKMAALDAANRHALLYGTLAGSFGYVAPVWDAAVAQRLAALEALLARTLQHTAGLNPHAFRRRHLRIPKAQSGGEHYSQPSEEGNSLLDGNLLGQFCWLEREQQAALASQVDSSPKQILADLSQAALATTL